MKRYIGFVALTALIGLVAGQALVRGQDRVERRDKKAGSVPVTGKILEENAGGVKIKPQGGLSKEEVIPSSEIVRVGYGDYPIGVTTAIQRMDEAEKGRNYPVLLKGYEAVQAMPELKSVKPEARRYIDYRVASLRAASAETDEQTKAGMKALADFAAANPDSWEYPHAARQLARLQADLGDYAGAARTFEALDKAPTVPAEFKDEARAALIDLAFQANDVDAGRKRIEAVAKDPKITPALKDRVAMYQLGLEGLEAADLAATVKKLEEAINKAADPGLKALGYNLLGDVYLKKGQRRDAMWSYLWVDVIYNQDRGEHLKAMTRLAKLFEEDNDKDKAQLYKDKVARSR